MDELARRMLRDHQVALTWFDVLVCLAEVPGGRLSQRTFREQLLLSESGVSRMLARMEREGLIRRESSTHDKRALDVTITQHGSITLRAAIESHIRIVDASFTDRFSDVDRRALKRISHKLALRRNVTPVGE
ncbi:MarR family transcriptional regulator [Mycolicibacterium sp. BiH015]|uniref:MarR family winged helix-turn-helix transcriptional regulator n=1 Tax=Mycolicibacterium sp. BiH015 TaxID=3018808 RepID=UPI0022E1EF2C|nr:MarR family transcriptional regulator [Mycolicibacterium sp. BiH015]MDA2893277.1 MarR family transcriptional regulator [Mycolicibacterium sp. BiH015]